MSKKEELEFRSDKITISLLAREFRLIAEKLGMTVRMYKGEEEGEVAMITLATPEMFAKISSQD